MSLPLHSLAMIPLLAALPLAAAGAEAERAAPDAAHLHRTHCLGCHDSALYTRAERSIDTRAGLFKQVERCVAMLQLPWFDEEVAAVAEWLDGQYYHLAP